MTDLVIPEPVPDIPVPPSPTQSVTDFKLTAWAWTAAQQPLMEWVGRVSEQTYQNAVVAKAAETGAASLVSAERWQAGVHYAAGVAVYSPANGRSYRRREPGGATAVDPSLDPVNWIDVLNPWTTVVISADTVALNKRLYIFAGQDITLTLPDEAGWEIGICDATGSQSNYIDPGGARIGGYSGVMLINRNSIALRLQHTGVPTIGWIKQ